MSETGEETRWSQQKETVTLHILFWPSLIWKSLSLTSLPVWKFILINLDLSCCCTAMKQHELKERCITFTYKFEFSVVSRCVMCLWINHVSNKNADDVILASSGVSSGTLTVTELLCTDVYFSSLKLVPWVMKLNRH